MKNLLFAIFVSVAFAACAADDSRVYLLFEDGGARAEIALPRGPAPEEERAALLLSETLARMGGVEIPVVSGAASASALRVHVGRTEYTAAAWDELRPADFERDGFVIHPADERNLILAGESPMATFYAVVEFLEEYAGVLYVWPTELGTVTPRLRRLEASVRPLVARPAFPVRSFYGMESARARLWRVGPESPGSGESGGCGGCGALVLPAEMWDEHPERFALIDGVRREPSGGAALPCTTNADVIRLYVDAARERFARYPLSSFSVSRGDGGGAAFCQCERCAALDIAGEKGFSDRWFTFVNEIARAVGEDYPGRFVVGAAYGATRYPPVRTTLLPNVMVRVALHSYADASERQASVVAWSKVARRFGGCFRLRGQPVPGFYPRRFAEYLRFLRKREFTSIYAEVGSEGGEFADWWVADGPRAWLLGRLLWNPDTDVEALMDRFLVGFYGPAAEPMRRYYEVCETAWNRRDDPFDFGSLDNSRALRIYNSADIEIILDCFEDALGEFEDSCAEKSRVEAQRAAWTPFLGYYAFDDIARRLARGRVVDRAGAEEVVEEVAFRASKAQFLTEGHPFDYMPEGSVAAIERVFGEISAVLGAEAEEFWAGKLAQYPLLGGFIRPRESISRGE